jgi:hypothetical protein
MNEVAEGMNSWSFYEVEKKNQNCWYNLSSCSILLSLSPPPPPPPSSSCVPWHRYGAAKSRPISEYITPL